MSEKQKTFSVYCHCTDHRITFRVDQDLDHNIVTELYCPDCLDEAPEDTVIIEMTGIDQLVGLWGVTFNRYVLEALDKNYDDSDQYLADLFNQERINFDLVPPGNKNFYKIISVKKGHPGGKALSGPDRQMMKHGPKPSKLPKDKLTRPNESPRPLQEK